PIAEKVTAISHLVADELPGHSANASQGASAHAAQLVQEGSADVGPINDHGTGGGHGDGHAGGGSDDAAQGGHKIAAAAAASDAGADTHQATIDASHAAAVSAVQKAAFVDDAVHAPVSAVEAQSEANGAFLLMQQKVAATMAQSQSVETFAIHVDLSANTAQAINVQDVTSEALQLLSIHVTKSDLSATKSTSSDGSAPQSDPASGGTSLPSGSTEIASSATPTTPTGTSNTVAPTQPSNAPQVVDVVHVSGEAVIQAISNFVTSEAHNVSSQITLSTGLQQQLAGYFGNSSSLKVIFFESDNPMADVFAFSSDVVFVNEKDVSPSSHLSNGGGNLILDVTGGTVTLVGVTTIEHTAAV
ncbi:MAG TPA: hypothetical protein VKP60_06220, partial [Magnetospirillaceae bacterium]|nr:hypothetical protein [Magnetospirillaceae bacterium]